MSLSFTWRTLLLSLAFKLSRGRETKQVDISNAERKINNGPIKRLMTEEGRIIQFVSV
jgi:hypothetical protein